MPELTGASTGCGGTVAFHSSLAPLLGNMAGGGPECILLGRSSGQAA